MMKESYLIADLVLNPGYAQPFGVSILPEGVNFALFSGEAKRVTLCLFNGNTSLREIALDPKKNQTGNVWHILIKHLPRECCYAYRIEDGNLLLDPYAKAVTTPKSWGQENYHPKGVVFSEGLFDWKGVTPPEILQKDLVIYEMHVRGFTQDLTSDVQHRGTFLGVVEKIPYLLQLGINAVELLPVQEFNEMELPRSNIETHELLYNYWGYSSVNWFSFMNRYAVSSIPGAVIGEFKIMVRELHRHGIKVILDSVFNHTAEALGGVLSYAGIARKVYYMVDSNGDYLNFSGCGNTVNANHPIVRELIQDCLRYLVVECHVDGFRFDLASALKRGEHGDPLLTSPLIEAITKDPVLAHTLLIAEPWDAAGFYEVGNFLLDDGVLWHEWNGKYRDNIRRFIKGNDWEKQVFATRISGSEDLYGQGGRSPLNSINFVTAHDGFTLADLVSYNEKHNEINGEENRDGLNENESWNCGVEGNTRNKKIIALRQRQMRNHHVALMISQGIPMILMGDEYGHTRQGNNNAWSHDNELNWFLWDKLKENSGFYRFYSKMIHFRNDHELLKKGHFMSNEDIEWHGIKPLNPCWDENDKFIAFTLKDPQIAYFLYIAFNASYNHFLLTLPELPSDQNWYQIVDTHQPPPRDYFEEEEAPILQSATYRIEPYSAIILKTL